MGTAKWNGHCKMKIYQIIIDAWIPVKKPFRETVTNEADQLVKKGHQIGKRLNALNWIRLGLGLGLGLHQMGLFLLTNQKPRKARALNMKYCQTTPSISKNGFILQRILCRKCIRNYLSLNFR